MTKFLKENIFLGGVFLISPFYSLPFVWIGMMRRKRLAFFLWAFFMGLVGLLYAPTGDLYRYNEVAINLKGLSFSEVTEYCVLSNEFVLGYLFYILNTLGIDPEYMRFIYPFVAYLLLGNIYLDILETNEFWQSHKLMLLLIIMPINLAIFLFRFYFSMAIFLYGAYKLIFRNQNSGWLFIIFSVLNHFSYLIFAVAFLFYRCNIFKFKKWVLITLCIISAVLDAGVIVNSFMLLPEFIVNRYIAYFDGYFAGEYLEDHSLRYRLWLYSINLMSYIGIAVYIIGYNPKYLQKSPYVNIIFLITSLTSAFTTIYNRFLIVLFMAVKIFCGFSFDSKKYLRLAVVLTSAVMISNVLNLWAKRREISLSDYQIFLYETTPQIFMHRYSPEWIGHHVFPNGDYQ